MKIRLRGADRARGLDVDVLSVLEEMVVDVVEELRVCGVLMIRGHVDPFGGGDDRSIGQRGAVSAVGFDRQRTCDHILFDLPFRYIGDALAHRDHFWWCSLETW